MRKNSHSSRSSFKPMWQSNTKSSNPKRRSMTITWWYSPRRLTKFWSRKSCFRKKSPASRKLSHKNSRCWPSSRANSRSSGKCSNRSRSSTIRKTSISRLSQNTWRKSVAIVTNSWKKTLSQCKTSIESTRDYRSKSPKPITSRLFLMTCNSSVK